MHGASLSKRWNVTWVGNNTICTHSLSSGVSTANHSRWLVLLCCNVISPRVSTANLHAGWSLSAVIFSLSPQSFQLPVCLIRCNFVSLSSEVLFPFFHVPFCCKVDANSGLSFTSSLSNTFIGTVPHPQFLNLSLLWSAVSAARQAMSLSAPSPVLILASLLIWELF